MDELLKKVIGSESRRLLAFLAGILFAKGYLTKDQVAAFEDSGGPVVAAIVLYLATSVWGWFKNRKVQKVEDVAKAVAPLATLQAKGKF